MPKLQLQQLKANFVPSWHKFRSYDRRTMRHYQGKSENMFTSPRGKIIWCRKDAAALSGRKPHNGFLKCLFELGASESVLSQPWRSPPSLRLHDTIRRMLNAIREFYSIREIEAFAVTFHSLNLYSIYNSLSKFVITY